MSRPRVSLCIPTWNGARYVAATLESALAQTFPDFELLLVDDGSSDATLEVARGFDDPRVSIHRNDRRLGIPGNWNHCVALSRGEFVKFLFQDDLLAPEALARLVAAVEAVPEASLAFSRREIRHEGPRPEELPLWGPVYANALDRFYASQRGHVTGHDLVACALDHGRDLTINVVGEPSFVLVRREAVVRAGGFDPGFRQLADWDLWLRLAREAPLVLVDESLGVFRVHSEGQSAANHVSLRMRAEFLRLLTRVRRQYRSVLSPESLRLLSRQQWSYRRYLVREVLRRVGM